MNRVFTQGCVQLLIELVLGASEAANTICLCVLPLS
jgi:hypothetical protein